MSKDCPERMTARAFRAMKRRQLLLLRLTISEALRDGYYLPPKADLALLEADKLIREAGRHCAADVWK